MTMLSDDSESGLTPFFERLVAETEADRKAFLALPIIQAALSGGISKEVYLGYLCEAFHHVKHTVPLMAQVKERLAADRTAFHIGLAEYAVEKKGQERWILHDIELTGGNAEAVRNGVPSPATEELVAFVYDYVSRVNPMGIFGMIYVIEGTGSGLAETTVGHLIDKLDLPRKCFSYILSHGFADLADMGFFELLMTQVTDRSEQDAIIHMAQRMYKLYGCVFQAIADRTGFSAPA